jgi:hypothetical protein
MLETAGHTGYNTAYAYRWTDGYYPALDWHPHLFYDITDTTQRLYPFL